MSVINKMLKDLDNRQDSSSLQDSAVPRATTSQASSNPLNKALISLLVIIVCLLAIISWKMVDGTSNVAPVEKYIDGVAVIDQVEPPETELLSQKTSVEPTEESKVVGLTTPDPAFTEELEPEPPLLDSPLSAESSPVEQSPAQQSTAELSPTKQLSAEEPAAELDALPKVDAQAKLTRQSEITNQSKLANQPETDRQPEVARKPAVKAETVKAPEATFVIQKTSSELTPEQRVEKLLAKAKTSYDRGYVTEAIEQLTRILAISDSNVEARNLLAAAWYGRGEGNKAVAIINDGLQRYPLIEEWRVTAAKIFFKDNNPAGAFSYLDVNLESASKEFYTLKGNLARELKYYFKAEAAYLQLTRLEPFIGNWWLGLAIAQDSQAKKQQAVQSYKKVLDVGGVSAQSITFSQQRIDVLQG
ncbi:tetratricopeptide repeat protein [Psychrosphaera haliotis]|uniref:Tetratricopeptide repeat protein n=1 Tax=Psychrosphaera haliotis TaxID=555083 RepID=A0A6N8F9D0_9GAMM|nr:hypothetical protein [Psychrosphaera haliotis]MUH72868.1 hypothetical protein [Psychrosphaera haliotis]